MNDEQLKRAFRSMVAPNTDADDWRKFSAAMTETANARTDMYVQAVKERDAAIAERDRLQAEVERLRGAVLDIQAECNRCFIVQGVPAAETPTTHGYGKILDIAARSLLASGDAR